MFVKHFRNVRFRVPDPQHPGRTVFDERLDASGTHAISHEGAEYRADESGWFDLPEDVAKYFATFPGWRTPEQVDEDMVAGLIRADPSDVLPKPKPRTRK